MSENESKKHEASKRKLKKQREMGSVANSSDSSGMFSTLAGLIAVVLLGPTTWSILQAYIIITIDTVFIPFEEARAIGIANLFETLRRSLQFVVGVVLGIGVLSAIILNNGILFSMKPVTPDLARVAVTAGIKRVFGKRGMIETLVALTRLSIWLVAAGIMSYIFLPNLFRSHLCGVACMLSIAQTMTMYLVYIAMAILLVFAIVDILVQRNFFMSEQKMTDTESKREKKDQTTSKEVAQERNRRKGMALYAPEKPLREEDTTILFWGKRGYVGINYDPPAQQLPLICAKARHGKAADELRTRMKRLGVPIMESENIVDDCMGKNFEEYLDPKFFKDFGTAMASR